MSGFWTFAPCLTISESRLTDYNECNQKEIAHGREKKSLLNREERAMSVSTAIKKFGLEQAFRYLYQDPDNNLIKLMDWADRFSGGEMEDQRRVIREAITDSAHPYYPYIRRLLTDIDPDVMKTAAINFFVNAGLSGWSKQEKLRKEYGCNIPWAILLDPTSACNLHCTGCWAAEYGNKLNLSLEEIDGIIRQGKELGVYMYIYTGGEPLVRKSEIPGRKTAVCYGFPERRGVCRRLHCRRVSLSAHQCQRRCGPLRLCSLFRLQYPGEIVAGCAPLSHADGLS